MYLGFFPKTMFLKIIYPSPGDRNIRGKNLIEVIFYYDKKDSKQL